MRINQKVLSELLLKCKIILLQNLNRILRVAKCRFRLVILLSLLIIIHENIFNRNK